MNIALISSSWELLASLAVFFFGAVVFLLLAKKFNVSSARALLLYVWHTFFCFLYCWYVLNNGGDAIAYFRWGEDFNWFFSLGTKGVVFISGILIHGVGLSFLGVFLVFNIFGAIGLLAFDGSLKCVVSGKDKYTRFLASVIVFLPSISFWSAGLGKDALSFFSVGLAVWSSIDIRRRWCLLVLALSVMLLVRPHMAGILGLGLASSFVLQRRVPFLQRVLLGASALMASFFLVPFGLNYAGVSEGADASDVISYIETRQGYNLDGGGAVEISEMSLPIQLFTYLFRPTLFEVRDPFSLAAGLDNLILLFLFVVGGRALIKSPLPSNLLDHNRIFLWVYSILAWLVLAMTTANLGIALRQKWMFAPMLIFLLISVVGRSRDCRSSALRFNG